MMQDNHECPWQDSNTYQTGSTTPPKNQSGLVAILLVLVVFLSGLTSILSLLNIRLFSFFYETEKPEVPLSLEIANDPGESTRSDHEKPVSSSGNKTIGILGDPVTPVYQKHFQLPEGIFITYVEPDSTAALQDIQEGDVLVCLNNIPMTDLNALLSFLDEHEAGDECTARIYRRDTDEELTKILKIETVR